jgi:hypothetical protein
VSRDTLTRLTYRSKQYAIENLLADESREQLMNGATAIGNAPFTNMGRAAGGQNLAASSTGVMQGSLLWLPAGAVLNKIACYTRTTAGATLTHRWVALYTPGGAALARQSTDITTATVGANAFLEFSLSSAYTVPADGLYPIGIMWAGTTIPTLAGAALGIAALAAPAFTGFTPPPYAWTAGSGLTTTAPAGPLTFANVANVIQFWTY